jgi:hypothetical protein
MGLGDPQLGDVQASRAPPLGATGGALPDIVANRAAVFLRVQVLFLEDQSAAALAADRRLGLDSRVEFPMDVAMTA